MIPMHISLPGIKLKITLQLNLDTENTKLFLENVLAFHSRYTEEHGTEPFTEANAFHTVAEFMLAGQ